MAGSYAPAVTPGTAGVLANTVDNRPATGCGTDAQGYPAIG